MTDTPHPAAAASVIPRPATALLLTVAALGLLLRVPGFYASHEEGDERVFLELSDAMGWDLSHYTTADLPGADVMPTEAYRAPLFIHPPLLLLVLKLGQNLGAPVEVGLLFQAAAMALLLWVVARGGGPLALAPGPRLLLLALLAACPLLLFSTSRLHLDGLLTIFLFCGVVLFLEAAESGSLRVAAAAGLALAAALNTKYSALIGVPLLPLAQALHLWRRAVALGTTRPDLTPMAALRQVAREREAWRPFLVTALVTVALGAPHYLRFLFTYGTLDYRPLQRHGPTYGQFSFLLWVEKITRWEMAASLVAIYPFVPFLAAPRRVAAELRRGEWRPFFVLAALWILVAVMAGAHGQTRYFAPFVPFAAAAFAWTLQGAAPERRSLWQSLAVVSIFCVLATAIPVASLGPIATVPPWPIFLSGPFQALYWGR